MFPLASLLDDRPRLTLANGPEGVDALVIAEMARQCDVLHIAREESRLRGLVAALQFFAPDLEVLVLPAWDCLPYDRVSPGAEITARRMDVLSRLAVPKAGQGGRVTLVSVEAALQRLPPRAAIAAQSLRARVGEDLAINGLAGHLTRIGYVKVGTAGEPGEFAVRGGIVDILPPGAEEGFRLDFFGDTIESIRRFDPASQRTTGTAGEIALVPASEVPFDQEAIRHFRQAYVELFGAVTEEDPLYEAVSAGRRHAGVEHWLALFHERLDSILDYCPGALVTEDAQLDAAIEARLALVTDYHAARVAARSQKTMVVQGTVYKPPPPGLLYLTGDTLEKALDRRRVRIFEPFTSAKAAIDLKGKPGRDFAPERAQGGSPYQALAGHLAATVQAGKRPVVAAASTGSRDRLMMVLRDHGIEPIMAVDSAKAIGDLPRNCVALCILNVDHGFETAEMAVVSEQDLLGDRLIRASRRARKADNFLTDAATLSLGDYVVHVDHGIGRFEGLKTIEVTGAPHDCLHLTYDGGDKLFLPVENIELLTRYGSGEGEVQLDKLGGGAWQARKAKLKRRIREIATHLIDIAAKRALKTAARLDVSDGLYQEFCTRFPYEETEDQLKAIADVMADMTSGKPMDRLVCGDVGFGKTEVALRAAFIGALSGKQVAVVAPTTLLCRQHFATFSKRFAGLPVRIGQLSRLVTAKEAAETRKGLADGDVDIVIGTHALLGKTIAFKDLGLLVIDEEQHFGVNHKERLKQLRADVHVLTLTATPIPRTLQLAMSGVRELSIIATPPVDRLAIRTFVMPFDPVVIREAILREHYRGGQSFYVVPRIADLDDAAEFLREHVPEVKFVKANGQMAAGELDDVMNAFYDGKFDVLLATTIVESGLDIPTANTLIVHRADMFGLAQLYQIRGRIGRSKNRAFAYLTTPPRMKLSSTAERRLEVLQSLEELGAGFTLASHDLDIRGAGNMLGEEQSGHIREVGFELYQEMLEEAIANARLAGGGKDEADDGEWSPQINVGASVLIPEGYVADLDLRMTLYRRISRLENRGEIDGFAAELIDRFGPLPDEVKNLLSIVEMKAMAKRAGIEKLDAGPKGGTVTFRNQAFANPAGLVQWLSKSAGTIKLRPDQKLVWLQDWSDLDKRLKGAFHLALRLAEIADAAPDKAPAPIVAQPPKPQQAKPQFQKPQPPRTGRR
ncbi:MAG: transcription-repair coupling factor [Zavarzinia sp.]|nr:transcription-repair coupling factor [Zavarzinia sp.]